MSLTLNMVGGGGGSGSLSAYAYIVVEHDSGATITCTNAKKVISLSDTMSLVLVSDSATSCVVTATTTSGVTNSTTVAITSGESYYILLYNRIRFVYNGVIQGTSMTTDNRKDENSSYGVKPTVSYETGYVSIVAGGSGTYNGAGTAYFPETVDLSKFTTLHVQGTARNNTGTMNFCAADIWESIGSAQADNRRVRSALLSSGTSSYTAFDITADISSYTDTAAYIGFNVRRNSSGYSAIRLIDVWVD